jgi:hypothetical protein
VNRGLRGPEPGEVPQRATHPALEHQARCLRTFSQRVEEDVVRVVEQFAHHQPTARLQHSPKFAERSLLIGNLAQDQGQVRGVEASSGQGRVWASALVGTTFVMPCSVARRAT